MSFNARNNRISVSNSPGVTVFDTDRKMPVIIGAVSGSVFLPAFNSDTINHVIGYADKGVTFIFPTFRYTVNSAGAFVPSGIPISSPGTVIVDSWWIYSKFPTFWQAAIVTVVLENGVLILRKRGRNDVPITIEYKVYLGRFV